MMKIILILFLIVGRLCESASAASSLWGWDGGCPVCPEHVNQHLITQAAWVRAHAHGDAVYPTKNSVPNWTQADRDVNGWYALGVRIILSTTFHPAGLRDDEVLPWRVAFSKQCLERYGNKIYGIEPANEPWIENDNAAKSNTWGWINNRLGATHTNQNFWIGGTPGPTTNSLTPAAIAWLTRLRDLHAAVRALAAPRGIKVYGPHWQSELYTDETRVAAQLGLLDSVDVFSFGCIAASIPSWSTWIDQLKPILGTKPWAVTEFHLRHAPIGLPDADHAKAIQSGLAHWREQGVQCVLVHTGLQNWYPRTNTTDPGGWFSMAGYIDDRTSESLRVLQVELSASSVLPVLVPAWTNAPAPPVILPSEIDALSGLSTADAKAVVDYLKAKGIAR